MVAICGWIGEVGDQRSCGPVLDGMLGACAGGAGEARLLRSDLAAASVAGVSLVSADDDLVLVLSEPVSGDAGEPLDARAVADLWRDRGADAISALHGPFALAAIQPRERRVVLAVDRAGIRPLYFTRAGGVQAFSSRLAGLASLPELAPKLSDQALYEFLYFHVVPSPGTIYEEVEKLLPAQAVELGAEGRREWFYWEMPYRDDNPAGFDALKCEFRSLLPDVVDSAASAPGPGSHSVGCFLSGGTDSSTVAGTLRSIRGAPVRTYSMGFEAEGFDEIEYARLAARHFQAESREYYVKPQDVLEAIPEVAAYTDEPFANASVVPAYLCARFAREDGITRLLAGDGGDEIFGGNARYVNQQVFEIYRGLPALLRRGLIDPAVAIPGLGAVPILRKIKSYVTQARVPLPDRLESYNFLHRTPIGEIFEPEFLSRVDPQAPLRSQRECYARARSEAIVNRMMHLDLKITLADNDLRKVAQACELAGVDVRFPLLDERLMAFAASVPPEMQLKENRLRWFFKQALKDFLPPEIIAKKKHGFGLPVGLWMAEHAPLRSLAEESLRALAGRGIVRKSYIDWLSKQHAGQHASYYGVMIWVLVMLEQWLDRHGH